MSPGNQYRSVTFREAEDALTPNKHGLPLAEFGCFPEHVYTPWPKKEMKHAQLRCSDRSSLMLSKAWEYKR
jgi:hypothetical protein